MFGITTRLATGCEPGGFKAIAVRAAFLCLSAGHGESAALSADRGAPRRMPGDSKPAA
jgi:hypothetical protein